MSNHRAPAGRTAFEVQACFIETAFEQRFQTLLRHGWQARSWHVIAAVPGSGKTLGIHDVIATSGARKDAHGTTYLPVLAVGAPKPAKQEQALGMALSAGLGMVPPMDWQLRRVWLPRVMASTQVECLIIDDAQDLTPPHLAFLKELTDNLAAPPISDRLVCV